MPKLWERCYNPNKRVGFEPKGSCQTLRLLWQKVQRIREKVNSIYLPFFKARALVSV